MKVREILEQLSSLGVQKEELLSLLENIGIEADLETEIQMEVVKKLGKRYKTDIKPIKVKKASPKAEPKKEAVKKEVKTQDVNTSEVKKQDVSKQDVKKQDVSKQTVSKQDVKKQDVSKQPVSKQEENKVVKKVEEPIKKEVKTQDVKHQEVKTQDVKHQEVKKQDVSKQPVSKQDVSKQPVSKQEVVLQEEQPKQQSKQENDVEVELTRVYDDTYNDYVKNEKEYTRLRNVKKVKKNTNERRQANVGENKPKANVLYFVPGMTVAQMADGLSLAYGTVVRKLVELGYMVSATQTLERDVIEILADEFGFSVKDKVVEDITKFEEINIEDDPKDLVSRPPIVTIMGHVDHGKTTLLDTIRNSRIAEGEAGAITQHIGAYQVKKKDQYITFIDTPGHAAFTEMRARGADVTDIVVLVVAADDGVMPQTKEAIEHAQAAKVPIIVAVNKMDRPGANPDRIKQDLTQYNLISEEWGGSTIFVPISALMHQGVDELLEMILLVSEMENFKANPNRLGVGTVLEAKLDKNKGPVATILVKNGTVKVGDPLVIGNTYGKVRAMQDETKANLKAAGPSKAVEIMGLVDVPQAGDSFMVFEDEKTARLVSEERTIRAFNKEKGVGQPVSLANLFDQLNDNSKELNLIIKGDVQGSIEALKNSLNKINVEGVKLNIVRASVGAITDTDLTLAVATKSIVIGFNIRPTALINKQAEEKGVEIRLYNIIYKLLEDIQDACKGLLDPVYAEKVIGEAEVRSIFKASKIGTIAGCIVSSGVVQRNAQARLIRDSIVVYTGKISSLKRFKEDAREVARGYECGLTIENYNDVKEGDRIEVFIMEKVQ